MKKKMMMKKRKNKKTKASPPLNAMVSAPQHQKAATPPSSPVGSPHKFNTNINMTNEEENDDEEEKEQEDEGKPAIERHGQRATAPESRDSTKFARWQSTQMPTLTRGLCTARGAAPVCSHATRRVMYR